MKDQVVIDCPRVDCQVGAETRWDKLCSIAGHRPLIVAEVVVQLKPPPEKPQFSVFPYETVRLFAFRLEQLSFFSFSKS